MSSHDCSRWILCLVLTISLTHQCSADESRPGVEIVRQYNALNDQQKKPGGDCYAVVHQRVNSAFRVACKNTSLPRLEGFQAFDRVWASKFDPKSSWLNIDARYRGAGPAGAMALAGLGDLVTEDQIWDGALSPGAVLQTWKKDADYRAVQAGTAPASIGHAFIFLEYVKNDDGDVTGMMIADQGTGWDAPHVLKRDQFDFWIGANIRCKK